MIPASHWFPCLAQAEQQACMLFYSPEGYVPPYVPVDAMLAVFVTYGSFPSPAAEQEAFEAIWPMEKAMVGVGEIEVLCYLGGEEWMYDLNGYLNGVETIPNPKSCPQAVFIPH